MIKELKSVMQEARAEIRQERRIELKEKVKRKLKELRNAQQVVANIEREIELMEQEISDAIDI